MNKTKKEKKTNLVRFLCTDKEKQLLKAAGIVDNKIPSKLLRDLLNHYYLIRFNELLVKSKEKLNTLITGSDECIKTLAAIKELEGYLVTTKEVASVTPTTENIQDTTTKE